MLDNKLICDDEIFARLTELFGDSVPTEIILKTGQETKWKLEQCIERLVKFDPTSIPRPRPMSIEMEHSNNNHNNNASDDDEDVLIESEEIQHGGVPLATAMAMPQMPSTSSQQSDASSAKFVWPTSTKYAGYAQAAAAQAPSTSSTNQRIAPNYKQPRLMQTALNKHPDVPEIIRHIEEGHCILICMRGAPGSGKSYLAKSIIDRTMHGDYDNHIFSTDDFFYDKRTKRYNYDRSKLGQAHESNQFRVSQRALNSWSPIIVDNTNMKWWEMFPYFKSAAQHSYIIKILEPNTPWRISVGKLAQRNKHGVEEEHIARMLSSYEPGKVDDILRAMQIHNYSNIEPKMRIFPEIQSNAHGPNEALPIFSHFNESSNTRFAPKDQRPRKYENNYGNVGIQQSYDPNEANATKLNAFTEQWPAFEEEQSSFWNNESIAKVKSDKNIPKPQRNPSTVASTSANISSNMFNLLQDKSKAKPNDGEKVTGAAVNLKKHKKDCPDENPSFQLIRQIYPQISLAALWDLFEKCNGDGNWTMDILLNESETKDMQILNTQEAIDRDNFTCDCGEKPPPPSMSNVAPPVDSIPADWLADSRTAMAALPQRNQRRQKQNVTCENDVVKHIEQQFVLSDNHYSTHSRKIRDLRRGATSSSSSTAATTSSNVASAKASGTISPSDDNVNEDDEMIEIDLGIELVCQLDQNFGSNTFNSEQLKDVKTKVFMPKSLGQQLYATWIESLYHQIEEQKQQSIKDDEEFARELQLKPPHMPILFENVQTNTNIQNVADMEYAWKAYNCNQNEWKQQSREDLAMKLTKAKLYEIFPNVEPQQLTEVFMQYKCNFAKTVEFFKESLKAEIGDQMQAKSNELVNRANIEAQTIQPPMSTNTKANKHKIQEIQTLDKLSVEDAKRAALSDFEENRNMAMHHAHLKAECYNKAREAFQRKQTGVAYYYTTVANLHNTKIDMFNHKAANAIMEVHSYTQQDPNMLDLHYLHADEAVECLDIYLDRHINELKNAKRGFKYVFIITGRGLHSAGGFSTIKHRVKCRLKERTLSWAEVNPGLLKVKLQYISLFTDNVNNNN